jgi:hypothetical protein
VLGIDHYACNLSQKKCKHYKLHWEEYNKKDPSDIFDKKRLFLQLIRTYIQVSGLCQNIGIAIYDYSIYKLIMYYCMDLRHCLCHRSLSK